MSRCDVLAAFFRARPYRWIDGRDLGSVGGSYAWRTRLADLRRAPYFMHIENRQRRIRRADGARFVCSEYCFRPKASTTDAVSSVGALLTAM